MGGSAPSPEVISDRPLKKVARTGVGRIGLHPAGDTRQRAIAPPGSSARIPVRAARASWPTYDGLCRRRARSAWLPRRKAHAAWRDLGRVDHRRQHVCLQRAECDADRTWTRMAVRSCGRWLGLHDKIARHRLPGALRRTRPQSGEFAIKRDGRRDSERPIEHPGGAGSTGRSGGDER